MILSKNTGNLGCINRQFNKSLVSCYDFVRIVLDEVTDANSKSIKTTCFEIPQDFTFPDFSVIEDGSIEMEIIWDLSNYLRKNSHRIFFFLPGYYFLGSQMDEVVSKTKSTVTSISEFLEMLGIRSTSIILRVGSAYGSRKTTMERFNSELNSFDHRIKRLISVTNDEKPSLFSVTDLLSGVYYQTKVPICFRFLAHTFNNGGLSYKEALFLSCSTWPEGEIPAFIYSESSDIDENGGFASAKSSLKLNHRIPTFGLETDVIVDSEKSKEACVRYMIEKNSLRPIVINKISKK